MAHKIQVEKTAPVPNSLELQRILKLPTRQWSPGDLDKLVRVLTRKYKTPNGQMSFMPNQAQFCAEIYQVGGGFIAEAVGAGKTLMSAIAPTVLQEDRPLLLVPASLITKTFAEFKEYRRHWQIPLAYPIISHEMLRHPNSRNMLHDFSPRLIVIDESQGFRNVGAAGTRRLLEYLDHNVATKLIVLTGSPTDQSFMDYWHQMIRALKTDAPVPYSDLRAQEIADAIDSDVRYRREPGALLAFCDGSEVGGELARVRQAYRRRLQSTWGVMLSTRSSCNQPIRIDFRDNIELPDDVADAIQTARTGAETLDGDVFETEIERWRYIRQLTMGFYYKLDPAPPQDWLIARKVWRKFVRETLERDGGLDDPDSPALVARQNPDHPWLLRWERIKGSYDMLANRHTIWLSDYLLEDAIDWVGDEPTLVWVKHIEVGRRLSELSGWEYLGAGKQASARVTQLSRPGGDRTLILSRDAHSKGHNLQAWCRNHLMEIPRQPSPWEQCIGRTHRKGQTRPVYVSVNAHVPELHGVVKDAIKHSTYVFDTTGQPQKLLLAKRRWRHKKGK